MATSCTAHPMHLTSHNRLHVSQRSSAPGGMRSAAALQRAGALAPLATRPVRAAAPRPLRCTGVQAVASPSAPASGRREQQQQQEEDHGPSTSAAEQQGGGGGKFQWERHWYPAAVLEQLDPSRPHAARVLGLNLVLWRDAGGAWRAFEDACPHRLAPLSEGRIEPEDGTLMCSYHGWRFDGGGACTRIPQVPDGKAATTACSSKRACARAYPARVAEGLLWVWPESGEAAEQRAAQAPLPLPTEAAEPDWHDRVTFFGSWFWRDLPVPYAALFENLLDPSHVPFSHHGVMGPSRRELAKPLDLRLLPQQALLHAAGEASLGFTHDGALMVKNPMKQVTTVTLPCFYSSKSTSSSGSSGNATSSSSSGSGSASSNSSGSGEAGANVVAAPTSLCLWFYAVPTAPGRSRIYARFYTSKAIGALRGLLRVPLLATLLNALGHVGNMNVLDGDSILLAFQEDALARRAAEGASWREAFYTPAVADLAVVEFRSWLHGAAGGGPAWPVAGGAAAALAPADAHREELLDRYHQHTAQCRDCSQVLRTARAARAVMWGAAALLAAAAALTLPAALAAGAPTAWWRPALLAGGAAAAAVAARAAARLAQQFIFVDYCHPDHE